MAHGVSSPSRGALKQSGNGHGAQAYLRSEERPPGKATAPNSDLTGPSSSAPRRRRQVDLSQNGYFISLSLSLSDDEAFFQASCSIRNMSGRDSDPDSILFSSSDEEQVSFDSILRTPEEIDSPLAQDRDARDNGWLSSGGSHDRISMQHSIPMSSTCVLQSSSSSSESVISPHFGQQVSHSTSLCQDPKTESCQEQVPPVTKKRRFSGWNLDGSKKFRLKSCRKEVFLRRLHATKDLDDDFYIPNRAKLVLDFLRNHGDRMVKERNGPRQSFSSTLALVQHVMQSSVARSSQAQ